MKRRMIIILGVIAITLPLKASTMVNSSVSAARAYPNPWRVDKHANMPVKFDGMPGGSTIKIFTISAEEVKRLSADSNGSASWDRTNDAGQSVASGVYIYLIIDPQGNQTSGKLAIIK